RHAIRRRFLTACKVLGIARARTLTIHHGRHTYRSCNPRPAPPRSLWTARQIGDSRPQRVEHLERTDHGRRLIAQAFASRDAGGYDCSWELAAQGREARRASTGGPTARGCRPPFFHAATATRRFGDGKPPGRVRDGLASPFHRCAGPSRGVGGI